MLKHVLIVMVLMASVAAQDAEGDPFAQALTVWESRGEAYSGGLVPAEPTQKVLDLLEEELKQHPDNLNACVLLLEAIYFHGDFVAKSKEAKQALYNRGVKVSEMALRHILKVEDPFDLDVDELRDGLKDHPQGVALAFWTSVIWGLWGDNFGSLQAARKGVATKIRTFGELTIELDANAFDGGGYRVLGRLHTLAPKIPFVTGWIDRDKAIDLLKRAVEVSDREPLNKYYLAEAILKFRKKERDEARTLLQAVIDHEAVGPKKVEIMVAKEKAQLMMDAKFK